MSIDLAAAEELFAASTDATVGLEEEFAVLDAASLDLVPRFEELRDLAAADDPVLAESIAGELISSEIEIRSGRGEDLARRAAPPARRPQAAVRAGRGARDRARRDRHPPVGRLPRAAQHRHRALPPRRRRPAVRRAAQQHVLAARPRRRARRRSRGPRLRPPAPGAAAAAEHQRQLARTSTRATAACTRRARRPSPRASRAAASPTPSARGRRSATTSSSSSARTRSSSTRRCGGRSARTSPSGPSRCASATRRRTAAESEALGGADRRLAWRRRARHRRGRAVHRPAAAADRGELLARDPLRPGRHA